MSMRAWMWVIILAVGDAVVFAFTIHSQIDFHETRTGPSVTDLNDVLGWIISFGLLVVVVLIVLGSRQAARHRSQMPKSER
jgi:hypothetical protein